MVRASDKPGTSPSAKKILLIVSVLFGIFILASLPNMGKISYCPPDADRIAMDGVFIFDFVRDLPHSLLHPYQYAVQYYARYPSLSIGQRPPLFPAVEAVFYALLGLTPMAPRFAVLLFLYMGMLAWVFLVTRTHNFRIALISLLLWLSNPNIYLFSQNILLEIPAFSMCILTLFLLYRYVSAPSGRTGILLGIVTGLMLMTNQKTAFMLPMFILYPLFSKNPRLLLARGTWILAAVLLCFLIPIIILTIWLGDHNMALSFKGHMAPQQAQMVKEGLPQILLYPFYLYQNHFSPPILILAILGIAIAILRRDRGSILYGLNIFCVYLTFTLISVKVPRYAIYWIPAFCFFAALPIYHLGKHLSGRIRRGSTLIPYILYALPIIFQVWASFPVRIYHVSGYEAAAQYVVQNSTSPVLFFTGMGNGQFSFFVRKLDPERRFMTLRGQKIISSSFIHSNHDITVYLHDREEIYNEFQRLGVQYAVVESPLEAPPIPAYSALRNLLNDPEFFTLEKAVPLEIRGLARIRDRRLFIYRNRNPKPIDEKQRLTLRVPVAGKTFMLTLGNLIQKNEEQ
jgi:hypothetical protein